MTWTEQANLGFAHKPHTKFQRQLFKVKTLCSSSSYIATLHSTPWGEGRMSSPGSAERPDKTGKERKAGEQVGASLGRNSFGCPSGLWPTWSGSLQTCPGVTLVLGQTSCEPSPKLPSDSFWEPTDARRHFHRVIQICVKHLPISTPVQDAKNMRILRTHNQVGDTDMLAGSYRVVKYTGR